MTDKEFKSRVWFVVKLAALLAIVWLIIKLVGVAAMVLTIVAPIIAT